MGNTLVHVNGKTFELLRVLGEGGFATVYEVQRDGRRWALKWTRGVTEQEDLERLLLEMQVMRRLQHRNVLPLQEAEVRKQEGDKAPSAKEVLMLFPVARGSLQMHLDQAASTATAAFTEQECLRLFAMVVDAVAALHALGFAHRDLKPGNILMSSSEPMQPLLMDFGSVAPLEMKARGPMDWRRIWEEAARFSSAPYRAPELWNAGSRVSVIDGRVDVWSLGCVLYAMAFGPLSPFEHPRDGVQQLAIVNGYVAFPEDNRHCGQQFSATFTALIRWILTPDVTERPTLKGLALCIDQLLHPPPRKQPSYTNVAVRRSSSRRRRLSSAVKLPSQNSIVVDDGDWADFSTFEEPASLEPLSTASFSSMIAKPPLAKRTDSAGKVSVRHASLTSIGALPGRGQRTSETSRRRALSQTGKQLWIHALEAPVVE